jgi:tripartite-type tricarboxylate transporter receptor subunit TctC
MFEPRTSAALSPMAARWSGGRRVLLALACVLAVGVHVDASAQPYPAKSVKVIVPYGPGTAPDVIARIMSEALGKRLSQPFVVENRTGAGGKIGTEAAVASPADGYTLFLGSKDTQSILQYLYPTWSVKPNSGLVPILGLARIQNVIVTRAANPATTLQEVVALSRTKQLSYGTPGVGTNLHLMGELLASTQGMKLLHVPYSRSFAEALPAAAQGDIDLLIAGLPPVLQLIKDGRIKALAITGDKRSPFIPNVPTFAEAGVEGLEVGGWFAMFAPTGTPAGVVDRLSAEIGELLKTPEIKGRLEALSAEVAPLSARELSQAISAESARWSRIISENGIRVE